MAARGKKSTRRADVTIIVDAGVSLLWRDVVVPLMALRGCLAPPPMRRARRSRRREAQPYPYVAAILALRRVSPACGVASRSVGANGTARRVASCETRGCAEVCHSVKSMDTIVWRSGEVDVGAHSRAANVLVAAAAF